MMITFMLPINHLFRKFFASQKDMYGNPYKLFLCLVMCMSLSACGCPAAPTQQTPAATSTPTYVNRTLSPENSPFSLTSPEVENGGTLPAEFTCDGASASLPLAWSNQPAETTSFALVMHHTANPQDIHWYWILYDIPASVSALDKNSYGIGKFGTNSVNGKLSYSPPCSKGPGDKEYVFTVYALSAKPAFSVPADQVNRDALLTTIQSITLASAELRVIYARK